MNWNRQTSFKGTPLSSNFGFRRGSNPRGSVKFSTRPTYRRRLSLRVPAPREIVDNEPEPELPPLDAMDQLPGYENLTFTAMTVLPPEPKTQVSTEEEPRRTFLPGNPCLSESESKEVFLNYVNQKCCFSKDPATNMTIIKVEDNSAYYYKLESFTEKRQVVWVTEPYTGGTVATGDPPLPWEVPCAPPAYFLNFTTHVSIPYTSSIKNCHTCGGAGQKHCYACGGNGWENCYYCQGLGHKILLQGETEKCYQCHGTGKKRCWKCNGENVLVCKSCGGSGQIKCYIQLIVTWLNHSDEEIVDEPTISMEKLRMVTGQIVFQEEQPEVWPILHFHNAAVNKSSGKLLDIHKNLFTNEKCLMQRHQVKVVPITTISYIWRNESGFFSVYGMEKMTYAPHYPRFGKISSCSIL